MTEKTGPKRSDSERERDYSLIADWYVRNWTHFAIMEELNKLHYPNNPMTRQQVSYDIQKVLKRWRDRAATAIDQHKADALARIDKVEAEFWGAWERSLAEREIPTKEGGSVIIKPDGDPRFMTGVLDCVRERAKLFGLYAPVRTNVTFGNLNDEQLIAYVKEQLGELGALAPGTEQAQAVPETESQDD